MKQYQVVLQDGRVLFLSADCFAVRSDGLLVFEDDENEANLAAFPNGAWAFVVPSGVTLV